LSSAVNVPGTPKLRSRKTQESKPSFS